jgi:UDP-GlcNAc:undecaprenyl-phosphate GlcNAc-1-phosphate transferase
MNLYVLIFSVSTAVCALLTWTVREYARRFGIVPEADAHHIHRQPIPRLGGIAIFLTFSCFLLLLYLAYRFDFLPSPAGRDPVKILPPAFLLFATGLFDDLRGLRARTKLLIQICGGLWLCWSGLCFPEFHLRILGLPLDHVLSIGMTVCWVVWVCNGINFIDGLDGLAAGTSFLLTAPILVGALLIGRDVVAMAATALAGAVLGFLFYNFNPATIFLGDSGSLFLGFVLSGLVLAEVRTSNASLRSLLIPSVAFTLPLADTALTVLRRTLSGRPLFSPDRKHIHHKLLDKGLSQRQVVGVLYGVSAGFVVLSLLFLSPHFGHGSVAAGSISLVIAFLGIQRLGYSEFGEILGIRKTIQLYRRGFVFNNSVRKTAEKMSTVSRPREIAELLETCLRQGFCGFELALDSRFRNAEVDVTLRNGSVRRFWDPASIRTPGLSIELLGRNYALIGRLCIYPKRNVPFLVDVDLLARELGVALGVVLERLLEPASDGAGMRPLENASLTKNNETHDRVSPALAGD